jgi:hypothetical protein
VVDDVPADSALFAPIEPYVVELATAPKLPHLAVSLCTFRYSDSGPLLRAALKRAADGELASEEDDRLFFRALFIVGGRRDPLGFEPLLRLLRRPQDEVEALLGDAITECLSRIATGVYDGNADALFDAIVDLQLDEFVRDALLGAATFLAWEGRIERSRMVGFLARFDSERLAPDRDMTWYSWLNAVALLGLRDMEPAVMAAWDRGAIPEKILEREDFIDDLTRAEQAPDDVGRFKGAYLGYIDDVLEALGRFPDEADDDADGGLPARAPSLESGPVINPWRRVGRNDPCPCGSGKKAKRCCLAA